MFTYTLSIFSFRHLLLLYFFFIQFLHFRSIHYFHFPFRHFTFRCLTPNPISNTLRHLIEQLHLAEQSRTQSLLVCSQQLVQSYIEQINRHRPTPSSVFYPVKFTSNYFLFLNISVVDFHFVVRL